MRVSFAQGYEASGADSIDMPTWRRFVKGPVFLGWMLASLTTALLSHAAIDRVGDILGSAAGADAYDEHAHTAIGPVAVMALILTLVLLLKVVACTLARRERSDPVVVLARRFGRLPLPLPIALTAGGGLAALIAMEFVEQYQAFGAIQGVGDALGGNAFLGFAVICGIAAFVTAVGLRAAAALLAVALAARAIVSSFLKRGDGAAADRGLHARGRRLGSSSVQAVLLARCRGMRAPPVFV
jgi:hypothetical protein